MFDYDHRLNFDLNLERKRKYVDWKYRTMKSFTEFNRSFDLFFIFICLLFWKTTYYLKQQQQVNRLEFSQIKKYFYRPASNTSRYWWWKIKCIFFITAIITYYSAAFQRTITIVLISLQMFVCSFLQKQHFSIQIKLFDCFVTLFLIDDIPLSFCVNTGISSSWILSDSIKGSGCPRWYRFVWQLSTLVLSRTGVTVESVMSNNLTKWSGCVSWENKKWIFLFDLVDRKSVV